MNNHYAFLINELANNNNSIKKWKKIESFIKAKFPSNSQYIFFTPPTNLDDLVSKLLVEKRINNFISVGGDGTLFYLINSLVKFKDEHKFSIGAIGLGSSNDFCKQHSTTYSGFKFKIENNNKLNYDLGKATFTGNNNGKTLTKYFISNASIGYLAKANEYFNEEKSIINTIKKINTDFSIKYTALKTLVHHQNISMQYLCNDLYIDSQISNISILKSPHVAGDFKYPSDVSHNCGFFDIKVCEDLTKSQLTKTLINLLKGRFDGANLYSIKSKKIVLSSEKRFLFELDGELFKTNHLTLEVKPNFFSVLTSLNI